MFNFSRPYPGILSMGTLLQDVQNSLVSRTGPPIGLSTTTGFPDLYWSPVTADDLRSPGEVVLLHATPTTGAPRLYAALTRIQGEFRYFVGGVDATVSPGDVLGAAPTLSQALDAIFGHFGRLAAQP